MSGYPGGALTAQQLADDGAPFIPKPFAPDVLLQKLREALECGQRQAGCDSAHGDARVYVTATLNWSWLRYS